MTGGHEVNYLYDIIIVSHIILSNLSLCPIMTGGQGVKYLYVLS